MQENSGVFSFPAGTARSLLDSGEMEVVRANTKEDHAREIMGDDFFGAKEVEDSLSISIDTESLPQIHFDESELKRAKQLGHRLVLRVSRTKDGRPLTMQFLNDHLQPEFSKDLSRIFWNIEHHNDDQFFTDDVPENRWALVSNEIIPGSTDKNYFQQTQVIANYLSNEIYGGTNGVVLPQEYEDALAEFEMQKEEIKKLISEVNVFDSQREAARRLTELKLNTLTRPTPVEILYDQLVYYMNTGDRLLDEKYTWTSTRGAGGMIVLLGDFDSDGMIVQSEWPCDTDPLTGVCISI